MLLKLIRKAGRVLGIQVKGNIDNELYYLVIIGLLPLFIIKSLNGGMQKNSETKLALRFTII